MVDGKERIKGLKPTEKNREIAVQTKRATASNLLAELLWRDKAICVGQKGALW